MSLMDFFRRKPAVPSDADKINAAWQETAKALFEQEPTVINVTIVQQQSDAPAWMVSQDGNITLVLKGRTYTIGSTHVNYEQIVTALNTKSFDALESLINAAATVERSLADVTVRDGQVFYKGTPVHNVVAQRIIQFMQQNLPWEPLALFLSHLMQNPSGRAVTELYGFLEANPGMAITEDGCFVGYKGVRPDFKDKYSGTFDNSVGKTVEMPRNTVDDDCTRTCSNGLHVGSHHYATGYASGVGDHVVLVKVNPRDAVSVPKEHGQEKLRVCRYDVLSEATRIIEEPLYRPSESSPDVTEDAYDDEFCDDCDESLDECVC